MSRYEARYVLSDTEYEIEDSEAGNPCGRPAHGRGLRSRNSCLQDRRQRAHVPVFLRPYL